MRKKSRREEKTLEKKVYSETMQPLGRDDEEKVRIKGLCEHRNIAIPIHVVEFYSVDKS